MFFVVVATHDGTHVVVDTTTKVAAGEGLAAMVPGDGQESSVADGPEHTCCADHLEEQVLPTAFAGTDHVLISTRSRGPEVPDMWRVVALADDVALLTRPTRPWLDGASLATAGDWIEYYGIEPFELVASRPVLVTQFLAGGIDGDPAMFVVPRSRGSRARPSASRLAAIRATWRSAARRRRRAVSARDAPASLSRPSRPRPPPSESPFRVEGLRTG